MACRNFVGITICFYDWRANFNSQVSFPFYFIMIACCTLFMTHVLHTQFVSLYLFICGSSEERVCSRLFPVLRLPAISIWISWIVNAKKKSQQATRTNKHKHTQVGFVIFVRLSFFIYEFHGFPLNILCCCWPRNPSDFHCQASENAKITKKSSQPATHFGTNWLTDWLTDSALPHKTSNLTGFH